MTDTRPATVDEAERQLVATATDGVAPPAGLARTTVTRSLGLLIALGVLGIVAVVSIGVGTKAIPFSTVVQAIFDYDDSNDHLIVRGRFPRTILGLAVGVSMGTSGALIQAMTRNPLADPGILGVNAGAGFAVVLAVGILGLNTPLAYVWFAFAGAVIATVVVYLLGSVGRGGATPVRLALSGVAVSAVLAGFSEAVPLLQPSVLRELQRWSIGTIADPRTEVLRQTIPFMAVGLVAALAIARPLNAVALGDDLARALGADIVRTRVVGVAAVTLMCGAATAAGGPISFVGFVIPHLARRIVGPDQRWIIPYTIVLSPILLLVADIIGRVVVRPGEMQVGIVTAFIGAPILVVVCRRSRLAAL